MCTGKTINNQIHVYATMTPIKYWIKRIFFRSLKIAKERETRSSRKYILTIIILYIYIYIYTSIYWHVFRCTTAHQCSLEQSEWVSLITLAHAIVSDYHMWDSIYIYILYIIVFKLVIYGITQVKSYRKKILLCKYEDSVLQKDICSCWWHFYPYGISVFYNFSV